MYPNRRRIRGQRHWKLAKLDIEEIEEKKASVGQKEQQREEFMKDLEEDPELRSQFDLYRGIFFLFYSYFYMHCILFYSWILFSLHSFFLSWHSIFVYLLSLEPGINPPTHDPDGDMDDIETDFPEVSVNELIDAVSELRI